MPKNKTHSGAKKRFRLTATGKVMREQAGGRHLLEAQVEQVHALDRGRRRAVQARRQEDEATSRQVGHERTANHRLGRAPYAPRGTD